MPVSNLTPSAQDEPVCPNVHLSDTISSGPNQAPRLFASPSLSADLVAAVVPCGVVMKLQKTMIDIQTFQHPMLVPLFLITFQKVIRVRAFAKRLT